MDKIWYGSISLKDIIAYILSATIFLIYLAIPQPFHCLFNGSFLRLQYIAIFVKFETHHCFCFYDLESKALQGNRCLRIILIRFPGRPSGRARIRTLWLMRLMTQNTLAAWSKIWSESLKSWAHPSNNRKMETKQMFADNSTCLLFPRSPSGSARIRTPWLTRLDGVSGNGSATPLKAL